jgi:hypothetical protein
VRKEDIPRGSDALRNPLACSFVDLRGRVEQHSTTIHVCCADKDHSSIYELVWSRPILPVIAIFNEQDILALKVGDY